MSLCLGVLAILGLLELVPPGSHFDPRDLTVRTVCQIRKKIFKNKQEALCSDLQVNYTCDHMSKFGFPNLESTVSNWRESPESPDLSVKQILFAVLK